MVKLRILLPDATVNYIKNPALRYDTTDWNAQGSTVTRTLTRARFGMASLKVVTNGSALNEGAYFRVSALSGISDSITVSAYVRGTGKVRIRLDDNGPGGNEYASNPIQLTDERWTRIEVTGRSTGGNDLRLYVETAEGVAKSRTFYVDGAQMERKPYATTYCDGDQEGCRWTGVYHASTSSRPASTRAGGRWVQLAGEEREAEDLYMTVAGGLGVAPLTNNIQTFALAAGGYHQNVKVNMRPITLSFHAKHANFFRENPVSLERLHELRQMLIDAVKPDLTAGDEDIWFEYTDGPIPLYFRARYDGGLEGDWDVRNQWVNSFPLRLLAVSPFFEEDSQEAQELDFQDNVVMNNVAAYLDGRWTNMNYGVNDWVAPHGFAKGPRGEIYAIGYDNGLTLANNNAAASHPLTAVRSLLKWNGEYFEAVSPAVDMAGGTTTLFAIAVHPSGDVYVTGSFTSIGGVAANYIARWDGSAWNALGTGLNAQGETLGITADGDVYVGGNFTTAGGLGSSHLARWDGSSWHLAGNVATEVTALAVSPDSLYVYYATNGTISAYTISSGSNAVIVTDSGVTNARKLIYSPSGVLHVVGARIYYLNNSQIFDYGIPRVRWSTSSTYTNIDPYDMDFFEDGTHIVVGQATSGAVWNVMALYNGSSYVPFDIRIVFDATNQGLRSCLVNGSDIFIGIYGNSSSSRQMYFSAHTTVINPGSMASYPIFYVKGSGTLQWIENQTTKKRIYTDYFLLEDEELTIDIGRGQIFSNLRANMFYGILPGSNFRDFVLLPGDNVLAVFLDSDVTAQMSVRYSPVHWSADATGRGDML